MLKNYFRTAWRNLRRNRGYSFINILGLATGMGVAMLIGLWIWDEVSFDGYHAYHRRLAEVMLNQTSNGITSTGPTVAIPPAEVLRTKYAGEFTRVSLATYGSDYIVTYGDKHLPGEGIWVQPDFPEMFTLRMLKGSRAALRDPSSVLLTQSLAKAIFGDEDPVNRTIRLGEKLEMTVAGVYEDLPANTTFYHTAILLSWSNKDNWARDLTDWDDHSARLFVELGPSADAVKDADQLTAKIRSIPTPYLKEWKEELMLQPLDRLHLYTEFSNGKAVGGRIRFVWLIGIIGVFVLFLGCINFMNLSTARSTGRAKEVGIRKTLGSLRRQLVGQFLGESTLVSFIAFVLELALTLASLPFFNDLSDKQLSIPWGNAVFWLLALVFTGFTGLVAGSYPALYLSGFNPIKVLKGTFRVGRLASLPRQALVVLQFTVSIALIICTMVVYRQIQYGKSRPVGYMREGLITVGINTNELKSHYDALRRDLLQTGVVENVAESSQPTTLFGNNNNLYWKGKDPSLNGVFFRNVNITPDFGKTIGWTVKAGRDFSKDFPTDSGGVLLNEASTRIIGFKNPIGEQVQYFGKPYTVIGVVNDMVTQSPYDPIEPAVFFCRGGMWNITIRVRPASSMHEALAKIEPLFRKYNPASPFLYRFNDDDYARKFVIEERIGKLATFLTVLAIFISCLGLFGLASFMAEQRTREIGVRKVLGASLFQVWRLLTRDFIMLVIISLLIAVPVAAYFMQGWLQNYQYRSGLSWWIFGAAGLGALAITLLTVSWQSIRAGLMNPVKSLRSE